MKMRKEVECNGTESENGEEIGQIGEEGHKFLGLLDKGDICQEKIKENIRKEYFKRLRAILKPKLNAEQFIPSDKHMGRIIEWTKENVKEMDQKTRKIITMYGGLHPRSNVERLYLPRSEGGSGLVSIED